MVDPLTCGVLPTIPLYPFPTHPPRPPHSPHPFPRSVTIIQYGKTALHWADEKTALDLAKKINSWDSEEDKARKADCAALLEAAM